MLEGETMEAEELELLDNLPDDGRKLAVLEEVAAELTKYPGASTQRFTDKQKEILEQEIGADELDILPTGEVYASQVRYRRILNDAFGPGGWALLPQGPFQQEGNTLCREYALFAEGRFVSSAIGEADFQPSNARMSKATAAESLKSNALMRCCKDLLIASECWDKRANEKWKAEKAVAVWCIGNGRDNKGEKKKLWRRKDAEPFEFPWKEGEQKQIPVKTEPDPQAEPVLDPNVKWLDHAKAQRSRLGAKAYFGVLGKHGFEKAQEVKDRKVQQEILTDWEFAEPEDEA
jgi:hypothetical protein